MTSVILQPAAGPDAQQHYRDTMESPVALSRIQPHVSASVMADLTTSGSGGGVRVWGVTPSGESKWNRIQPGDLVLFAGHGRFFASAQVIATAHSWGLADDLWGDDDDGRRWEFTYSTTPPRVRTSPTRSSTPLLDTNPTTSHAASACWTRTVVACTWPPLKTTSQWLNTPPPSRP